MMGLDIIGPLLIVLALSLMTVCPLHLTIARSKVKSAPITAMIDDRDADPVTDPEYDDGIMNDPLIRATAAIREIYDQA